MKKVNKKIMVPVVLAALLAVLLFVMFFSGKKEMVTYLERPGIGEKETVYSLLVDDGDREYQMDIEVAPKPIPKEKLDTCFEEAFDYICEKLPGENESLSNVTNDLVFTEKYEKYGMNIEYSLDDYSVLNCYGEIIADDLSVNGRRVSIYACVSYDIYSHTYEIPVTVYPKLEEGEPELISGIRENLVEKNDLVDLPEKVNGINVVYSKKKESQVAVLVLLLLAGFLLWYYKKFTVKKKAQSQKEMQMRLDYSEIVSKLSLLMGAGMNGKNAINKIAADYQEARKANKIPLRYAYEELLIASNRIGNGVSEGEAYAGFGRACHIHCYIKLGSLLAQNIKKGGEGFSEMLRNEVTESFMERKALARKAGEEAGTKLLLPMILMLGIVLVIIMVPAFLSF